MPPSLEVIPKSSHRTPDGLVEIDTSDYGLLGAGAHGTVRAGRIIATGQRVAVKISPASGTFAASVKELTVVTILPDHPNVVKTHSAQVSTDGEVYVVLELCPGGELFDKIAEYGGLPEPEAAHYFAQILAAIVHCHKHRVFHRDLKPENILLDSHDTVKVADFGLAALSNQEPGRHGAYLRHTRCGSVSYAAPEIYEGDDGHGYNPEKADIWSLGVVLYCMLTATMPFKIAHVDACERFCAMQAQGIRVLCPDTMSDAAVALLGRLLDPRPANRPSACELLADPWLQAARRPDDALDGAELSAGATQHKWSAMDRITQPSQHIRVSPTDEPPRKAARTASASKEQARPLAAGDTWDLLGAPTCRTPHASAPASAAPAAAPLSSSPPSKVSVGDLVRHLGWERLRGSPIDLMASIVESLDKLGVEYEVDKSSELVVHVLDARTAPAPAAGHPASAAAPAAAAGDAATTRARVSIRLLPSKARTGTGDEPVDKGASTRRSDLAFVRVGGTTLDFHSLYQSFRKEMAATNGWNSTTAMYDKEAA
mmetsp:Transcript_19411/g.50080  ORF Transcript_19411/g.50080 Transcript_19411/m.50080 type:complete len:542 (+) Transcript_19411:21-1646(+)